MIQHPSTSRKWITETAAALLLALPAAFAVSGAEAGVPHAGSGRSRTGASSRADRTPPRFLSSIASRLLAVQHRGQSPDERTVRDTSVRQVDHQQIQQTSSGAAGYSVQTELQRLYAEEGRPMPQMAMPTYRQAPAANPHTARQTSTPREERSSGLLAGLFDFGRSRSSRRNTGALTQPPVEPQPFRPPTYRQPPVRQPQTAHARRQRLATPPSTLQQPTAQPMQSDSVIELKRLAPERSLAVQGDEFFPEDSTTSAPDVAETTSPALENESVDDMAEFFPGDDAASPEGSATASTTKQQMQQLFEEEAQADSDGFQMPVETKVAIVPEPAPAAVSEVVTTTVTPPPANGLAEPAPFFADDERAIDPNESMEVAAIDGQTFDPSGADSQSTAGLTADAGSRMQQIAARDGVGLKGYCPVALRDGRRLADGKAAYVSFFQGKAYYLSTAAAKDTFDASPSAYAPASGGEDVTMKTLAGEVVEGSLDHSVWYKGRLYLFHTAENLKTFMAAPAAMAVTQ